MAGTMVIVVYRCERRGQLIDACRVEVGSFSVEEEEEEEVRQFVRACTVCVDAAVLGLPRRAPLSPGVHCFWTAPRSRTRWTVACGRRRAAHVHRLLVAARTCQERAFSPVGPCIIAVDNKKSRRSESAKVCALFCFPRPFLSSSLSLSLSRKPAGSQREPPQRSAASGRMRKKSYERPSSERRQRTGWETAAATCGSLWRARGHF